MRSVFSTPRSFPIVFRVDTTLILISFLLLFVNSGVAQRISYQDLLNRDDQPNLYIDHFLLPSSTSSTVRFVSTFRIDYKLLRFKKSRSTDNPIASRRLNSSFRASPTVGLELYGADKKMGRQILKDIDYQKLKPVSRKFWEQKVFADTYEQTKSNRHYISGYFASNVTPGLHRMLWQLSQSEDEKSITRTRIIRIRDTGRGHRLPFYYVDSLDNRRQPEEAAIINFGSNVYYGKDFHLLFQLPSTAPGLNLIIHKVSVQNEDTTKIETVYQQRILSKHTLSNTQLHLHKDSTRLLLNLSYGRENGASYGLVNIPNSRFENGKYQVILKNVPEDTIISRDFFQSRWINMPVSLLNIDVSIRMLKYIVEEDKIDQMLAGSREKRIKKFRNFWEEKDPTPETAYNELMAEYYRRIDQAYEKFSSINQPGFQTDMGKIYIRRGPPDQIERRFPSGERAVEVWKYPNKTYVFRATSGFGDFKLVSEQ